MTEQQLYEDALRQADLRKNEFLAMWAHELRNPLAPIHHAATIGQMPGVTPADIMPIHLPCFLKNRDWKSE